MRGIANGKPASRTTLRLAEARDTTPPPPDPVEAVKKSLVMTLYGRIGDQDVEQLVDSIKAKALAGDKHAARLLLDLVTKAAAGPAQTRVIEKVVMSDPGSRQLRLLCAYAIAHNGTMGLAALADLVGLPEEDAANLLEGCWFERSSRGYGLTTEGKQQVG